MIITASAKKCNHGCKLCAWISSWHQDTKAVVRVDRPEEPLQAVECHHVPLAHTQGCKSPALCSASQCDNRPVSHTQCHTLWPTGSAPKGSSADPLVLAASLLEPQSLHPSSNPAAWLPSPATSFWANDRNSSSKDLQCSFSLYMKVKSSENYSQNAIIDQNALLQFHSPFSHICFWPCQIRRMVSCPGAFSLKSQLPGHPLCFPELLTLILGGLEYVHTATACCFICPTRVLSRSQCSLKWSLCGSLTYCWGPCADIPCTTQLGMPSAGYFSSYVLIPGCP